MTIDSRLNKTFSYFAAFIGLGMINASLGPTLPALAANVNTQLNAISGLFIARSLGYLLGAFQGGRLYDRFTGHGMMAVATLVMAVAMFSMPLMSRLWLLMVIMVFLGMAESVLDVGANTLLVWIHRADVGPYMNALHFFFGLGAFLSPIIIAQTVLFSGDITLAYWILGLLLLPVSLWILRLASPPVQQSSSRPDRPASNTWLAGLIAAFLMLYVGAEVSYGGWVYTYAIETGVAGAAIAAYLTAAFWGALTAGRLLSIPFAARFNASKILAANLGGSLLSVALIWLWPHSLTVLWIGTLGLGLSMAAIFPTALSMAERRMAISGKITSWFFIGASLGAMTVPWLVGQLFEVLGPSITLVLIGLDLLLAVAVFVTILMLTRQHQQKQQLKPAQ